MTFDKYLKDGIRRLLEELLFLASPKQLQLVYALLRSLVKGQKATTGKGDHDQLMDRSVPAAGGDPDQDADSQAAEGSVSLRTSETDQGVGVGQIFKTLLPSDTPGLICKILLVSNGGSK
ncbi:MAG: hypothetical protein ACE15E_00545 [Acidobacteriota bacterium]